MCMYIVHVYMYVYSLDECTGLEHTHSVVVQIPSIAAQFLLKTTDSLSAVLRCKYIQLCVPIQENKFTIQLEAAVCL